MRLIRRIPKAIMRVVTTVLAIIALIGAASMDSESIVIPVVMLFGGMASTLLICKYYWKLI